MSVTRRPGSPYWYARFTVRQAGRSRRVFRSTGEVEKTAALTAEARLRAELARLGTARPRLTLSEALGTWSLTLDGRADAGNARLTCDRWLDLLGAETMIADLADADIAGACARLRARQGRRGGLIGPATVNRHLVHLRAALRHAGRALGAEVPAIDWRAHLRREPPGRDRWLSPAELDRLLAAAAPHLKPLILMAVWTGLRRAELARLDWRHVDLREGLARVVQKGGRRRLVYLPQAAVVLLAGLPGPKREGLVFKRPKLSRLGRRIVTAKGRDYHTWSWETAWRGALRRSGLTDLRWHDLRHTHATLARQAGADLKLLAESLGVTLTTAARYAHHGRPELRALAEAVAERTSGQPQDTKEKASGE